jgi:3-oxoadipate enol-lactonase
VCQHLAVRYPDRVASLALLGPFPAPPDSARQGLRERARQARAEGMAEIAEAIVQNATSAATKRDCPLAVALVREMVMRQDPEGYAATCEALAAAVAADLSRISCPVVLVTGDEDPVAPPSTVRAMDRMLPDSHASILGRCGHWTTLERVEEVNRELEGFLARMR